jgi:hypothetical protein
MPTAAAPRSTKISAKPAAKPEYDPEAIRERLAAVCEGYTLHRLQGLTGCFHETIRRQMNGLNKPSIQFLARIATCFSVSLDWLVLGVGEREAPPRVPAVGPAAAGAAGGGAVTMRRCSPARPSAGRRNGAR